MNYVLDIKKKMREIFLFNNNDNNNYSIINNLHAHSNMV